MPHSRASFGVRALFTATFLILLGAPAAAQGVSQATRPVWPDEGPLTWTVRTTEQAISANDLRTRLYQIADDSMRGRRIGEPGNTRTTAYIASEFQRLGLRPAGDSGTYFQVLPFGPLSFAMGSARLAVGGRVIAAESDWLPTAPSNANGFTGSAALREVQAVFAGRWDDTAALDAAKIRGKVAVFVSDAAPAEGGGRAPTSFVSCADLPDRFGAAAAIIADAAARANPRPAPPRGGARGPQRGDRRAIEAGAVGVLVIGLEAMTAAQRAQILNPRGTMRPATIPGANATVPAATISRAAAQRIFGRPVERLAVGATGGRVSASWSFGWRPTIAPARNVIAMLPGSDPALAHEVVLVGAHNDHVGTSPSPVDHDSLRAVNAVTRRQGANDPSCQPTADQQRRIDSIITRARSIRAPRLDSIFNGADDDGSGTAVLLEIAERFATERPARSILFISHQGEEGGLLGSRWFVEHPTVPLENIVAAHNMDMLGKGRVDQVKYGGPNSVQTLGARRLSREFGDIIDSVNAVRDEPMAIDKSWDVTQNPMNRFCRSDQVNYVNKNIPVTYFSLGYSLDYHQLTDDPQYIDYDHSARLARFIHDVMFAIAVRRDRPAIAGPDPAYPSCGR